MSKSKVKCKCGEPLEDRAVYDRAGAILMEGHYLRCVSEDCGRCYVMEDGDRCEICGSCYEVLEECVCEKADLLDNQSGD